MWIKLLNYGLFIVIGGLLFLFADQGCRKERYKRQASEFQARYDSCLNSPIQIDTIHDTIHLPGGIRIKPVPIREIVYETIYVQKREAWYDSTYKSDGWRFRWKAYTLGSLEEISFSDFVIPREIITITKTVDTCLFKLPKYMPMSHFWVYARPQMIIKPTEFVSATVGVLYTHRDRWGLGMGVGFDWKTHYPVAEAQFLISLK